MKTENKSTKSKTNKVTTLSIVAPSRLETDKPTHSPSRFAAAHEKMKKHAGFNSLFVKSSSVQ